MSFLSLLLFTSAFYFVYGRPDAVTEATTASQPAVNSSLKAPPEVSMSSSDDQAYEKYQEDQVITGFVQDLNEAIENYMIPMISGFPEDILNDFKIMTMNGFASYFNYIPEGQLVFKRIQVIHCCAYAISMPIVLLGIEKDIIRHRERRCLIERLNELACNCPLMNMLLINRLNSNDNSTSDIKTFLSGRDDIIVEFDALEPLDEDIGLIPVAPSSDMNTGLEAEEATEVNYESNSENLPKSQDKLIVTEINE